MQNMKNSFSNQHEEFTGSLGKLVSKVSCATPLFIISEGNICQKGLEFKCSSQGNVLKFSVKNTTDKIIALKEIVLADFEHGFPCESGIYGEGFSMFCSTGGTLEEMIDIDSLTDHNHYKLPQPEGFRTVYNYLRVNSPDGIITLFGFTSCRRFTGKFNINKKRLQIVIETEQLQLAPGQQWELEELLILQGRNLTELMDSFAMSIEFHHPRMPWPELPTGWCSWYCYGPDISTEKIKINLQAMKENLPQIKYIQIDDGYEPWMGDWLESTDQFSGGVRQVVQEIVDQGFEPAIWVAPFIASPESKLFKTHPDWFVKDENGNPLNSGDVTFGGWRQGPWFMLDGTHPEACEYIETVFSTLNSWGCTYFKLDANVWGVFPFGKHFDAEASGIEAYRRGMQAVIKGAGEKSYILGCNHPYWPSLGLIHGSRTSYDIMPGFKTISRVARENLLRNWMNNKLWWNDPDCLEIPDLVHEQQSIVLEGPDGRKQQEKFTTAESLSFHLTATYASGGMMLSGDAVVNYSEKQWQLLRKALTCSGTAAVFASDKLESGWIEESDRKFAVQLNWTEFQEKRVITLKGEFSVTDFWTDEEIGIYKDIFSVELPPRSGRLFIIRQ